MNSCRWFLGFRLICPLLLGGPCLLGSAAESAAPGLVTARIVHQGNHFYSVVENHSGTPMTAYAISIQDGARQRNRRFYDARMSGRDPIGPNASYQEDLSGIVLGVEPLAAVFADGTTFGDVKEVSNLMARRNAKLSALAETASILCNAERSGLDKEPAIAALKNAQERVPSAASPMLAAIQMEPYNEALDKLERTAPSRPISIPEVLWELQPAGTSLFQDPVKDASGNPFIKVIPAQLFCGTLR